MKTEEIRKLNKIRIAKYRKNPEFIIKEKKYYKKWYKKNGRKRAVDYDEIIKDWKIHHPKECLAHQKILIAIKEGIIRKPLNCSKCGDLTKLVGHHDDYDKSLKVKWLCQSCHKAIHAKNNLT